MIPWQKWVHPIERVIIKAYIDEILMRGYYIEVWDGECTSQIRTRRASEVIKVVGDTEVTVLTVTGPTDRDGNSNIVGWFGFVHGNLEDVMSDSSVGDIVDDITKTVEGGLDNVR